MGTSSRLLQAIRGGKAFEKKKDKHTMQMAILVSHGKQQNTLTREYEISPSPARPPNHDPALEIFICIRKAVTGALRTFAFPQETWQSRQTEQ